MSCGLAGRVLSDEVEVELDAPAGTFGQLEMAIDDFGVGAAGLFDVLIGEVVEVLEDLPFLSVNMRCRVAMVVMIPPTLCGATMTL